MVLWKLVPYTIQLSNKRNASTVMRMPQYIMFITFGIGFALLAIVHLSNVIRIAQSLSRGNSRLDRRHGNDRHYRSIWHLAYYYTARVPNFFNFLLSSLLTIIIDPNLTMDIVMSPLYYSLNNFPLLAIPLFMYAGDLMIEGNLSKRMVALGQLIAGKLPGNLGGVTVVSAAFYGAVCGSGPATAAVIGGMMEPDMKKAGYPRGYTAALIAAAGVLGMLIPPSNPAILLGFATGISTT